MIAAIVVRHFGEGIHLRRNPLEFSVGHAHRGQHERTARPLDLEHGTEARQHATFEHRIETLQQFRLAHVEGFRDLAVGFGNQREIALQGVDQPSVGLVRQCFRRRRVMH